MNLAATESEADRFALMDLDADAKARVRVLMAEDNLINQKVAKKILQALGFNPKVVSDSSRAPAAYVESVDAGEPFDLILMDLQMPVMDGVEATRAIVEHAADRPELGLPPRASSRSPRTSRRRWFGSVRRAACTTFFVQTGGEGKISCG